MLSVSDGFREAIVGDVRRMYVKAVVDIIDPDIVYGTSEGSGTAPWSKSEQLHDKTLQLDSAYATLEPGRWPLDGSCRLIPEDPVQMTGEVGHVGNILSGEDGTFPGEVYAELRFSGAQILQACTVAFSQDDRDGIPVDFTVKIFSGSNEVFTREYIGNKEKSVSIQDFTVHDPDIIQILVTKWSLPRRRMRIAEILPGVYEEWTGRMIASLDIQMHSSFSCLAVPYSTCTLSLNNTDRRFEPYIKSGLFESIEERQAIPVSLGVRLPDGGTEWASAGVYYQKSGGWETGRNDMTLTWKLVDIVGLLSDRDFIIPDQLPTTLAGWMAALVGQLGTNFRDRWHVDPAYAETSVVANSPQDLQNLTCGSIARYACMASGTWLRADQETGDLTAEPLWNQGNKLTPRAMPRYPTKKANDSLAALIFRLHDEQSTSCVVSGNSTSSSKTITVNNPFIHTAEQAQTAARQILSQYGGIVMETIGRGDPSSELGDVDTVWISDSEAKTGRRMDQSFVITTGVLKNCKSRLLQADGSFLFENRQVFTASGVFHTGPNMHQVRLILQGGGQGGEPGQDGSYPNNWEKTDGYGKPGRDGAGGFTWSGVIDVNPDSDYQITIGAGGKASLAYGTPGELGTPTTFGAHSSAAGKSYPLGFTDIASGSSYGRTGVKAPMDGSGDGGEGGQGGTAGARYWKPAYAKYENENGEIVEDPNVIVGQDVVIVSRPSKGKPGVDGAAGVCVVYWPKE